MSGLSRECRTCCRKQQNKIQPANKKKQARIFQARKYEVHIFQQAASLFPAWPASGPESNASRTPAHSFSAPAGQNLPFTFSSRSCQSVNRQMLFLQLRFPRRENTRCIFFQHPKPSFPAWPANTSRCKSYYNLQQDNSFHSGASRPIPPATILSIPAHNPQQANFLPPGLAGRRLTFLPTTFLTSTKHHLPTKYRSPPFFHSSSFFYFLYRRQHPSGLRLSVPTSHHFPNALHFFRPAAASPTRRPNAKRSFARGCSLQGCRGCGRGARVSFFLLFSFFSVLFFSLLLPFFPTSLAPRLRRDAFSFLFIFVLLFFLFFFTFFLSFFFSLLPPIYFLLTISSCFVFLTLLTPTSFLIIQPLAGHSSFFLFSLLFLSPFYTPPPCSACLPSAISFFLSSFFLSSTIFPTLSSSPPAAAERRKKIGKRTFRDGTASRERTGSGRKGRGVRWSPGVEG